MCCSGSLASSDACLFHIESKELFICANSYSCLYVQTATSSLYIHQLRSIIVIHVQVAIMEAKFKEFMGNEAQRLDRDVKIAQEKSAAEIEARAARRRAEWRAICKSRTQQLESRKAHRIAELEADKEFAAAWKARSIVSVRPVTLQHGQSMP
jgi:hypothetical protein